MVRLIWLKGTCNCQFAGRVQGDIIPTLIWNTCPKFEEQNVVPLFKLLNHQEA